MRSALIDQLDTSGLIWVEVGIGSTPIQMLGISRQDTDQMLTGLRTTDDLDTLCAMACCRSALHSLGIYSEFGLMYVMATLMALVGIEESEGVNASTDPNDLNGVRGSVDDTSDIPF